MTFQFHFVGGPLDGLIVNGSAGQLPRNHYDFAAVAFRDSDGGRVGAVFETFNPLMLADLPTPRPAVRLHIYCVTLNSAPFDCAFIRAHYVAPSENCVPGASGSFGRWAASKRVDE